MTDTEARETIRMMLDDWNAATPAQRRAALIASARAAAAATSSPVDLTSLRALMEEVEK